MWKVWKVLAPDVDGRASQRARGDRGSRWVLESLLST